MQQIRLAEPGRFETLSVAQPEAESGEALIRIHRIGVCGTDLHAFAGRQPFFSYPRVLGHELGAEIISVPDGDHGLTAGDKVAVEPYIATGFGQDGNKGRYNCNPNLQVLGVHSDGGMQRYLAVPPYLLHKSEELSYEQLALVETLGIGAHAVRRAGLSGGEDVLVIGAGPIGLAAVQFARAAGANVRVLDISEPRRNFVASLGIEAVSDFAEQRAEVVFDATGSKASMEKAFDYVEFGGKLVFVGLVLDRISFDDPQFHRREMTLLSSRNSAHEFPRIIGMIERGEIDTKPWVSKRMRLGDVPGEFPSLRAIPDLIKAVIEVDEA